MAKIPVTDNVFLLAHEVSGVGTTTHVLETRNTFLDKNISLKITTTAAGAATLNITDNNNAVTIGELSDNSYPLTANLTGQMSFASAGWITTGGASAADSSVKVGTIAQSTLAEATSSNGGISTISVTASPTATKYINITAGYEGARYVTVAPMSSGQSATATVSASGQIPKPTIANAANTISGMSQITLSPTTAVASTASGYKYFISLSVTATGLNPTITKTINRNGYLGATGQILTGSTSTNVITGNSNLYYATLPTASIDLVGQTAATKPKADQNTSASITNKTRVASTPTTATSFANKYFIAATLTALPTTVNRTSTTVTSGYISDTDASKITTTFTSTTSTQNYYFPIAEGSLTPQAGSVTATGNIINFSTTATAPASTVNYIKAIGSGTVKVGTEGWIAANTSTASNSATAYYVIPDATFTASQNKVIATEAGYVTKNKEVFAITPGTISVTSVAVNSTALNGYSENTTAIIPSGGTLLLSAGYYDATKISLATLVPDTTSNTAAAVSHILAGYKAFDKDGKLLTGTIPTYDGTYTYSST